MKKKSTTVKIDVAENDEFVGSVTMEFVSKSQLANVFYNLAEIFENGREVSSKELSGLLSIYSRHKPS